MENQQSNYRLNDDESKEFYKSRSQRVNDLIGGILGGLIFCFLVGVVLMATNGWSYIWFPIVIYAAAIIYFFYKQRHYIAIGMIVLITVPPLIVGGCMYLVLR